MEIGKESTSAFKIALKYNTQAKVHSLFPPLQQSNHHEALKSTVNVDSKTY